MRVRRGGVTIAAAVAALAGVWSLLPPTTPPLYDSLCVPANYHYFSPPPGTQGNIPAQGVTKELAFINGQQPTTEVLTPEDTGSGGTQAQLIITESSFAFPPGTTSVTLSITPIPAPATLPTDGVIDGNVYSFRATVKGQDMTLTTPATIVLAAAGSDSDPRTLEQFTGGAWKKIDSTQIGCGNSLGASVKVLGTFAVVKLGAVNPKPPASDAGPLFSVVLGLAALALLGAAIFAVRRYRART